ncbi:MAG: 5'-methylthioadenosine/adenosylhomocysteine nucleosidase [Ruminococcaceae bacterium]|nr:5'-methylthioadenosine/adenosylhomocysteine nucleosidase [Oscillospiraceae bacterium]
MKLGIIAAMTIEADLIKAAMTDVTTEEISGITFVSGKLGQCEAVVAVCGIGKVFAALCTQTMILRYAPDCVINTGVGGTLTDRLGIGDLAVSTAVVQHDMDTSALGDPVGLISGINVIEMAADKAIAEKVCAICEAKEIRYYCGTIASGDQFIASREKKDWIVSTFNGIACEMEGASVGQVCYVNKVPFVILRAISDSADGGACEDYPTFAKNAAKTSASVVLALAGL